MFALGPNGDGLELAKADTGAVVDTGPNADRWVPNGVPNADGWVLLPNADVVGAGLPNALVGAAGVPNVLVEGAVALFAAADILEGCDAKAENPPPLPPPPPVLEPPPKELAPPPAYELKAPVPGLITDVCPKADVGWVVCPKAEVCAGCPNAEV